MDFFMIAIMICCIVLLAYCGFMLGAYDANNKAQKIIDKKNESINNLYNSIDKYNVIMDVLEISNKDLITANKKLISVNEELVASYNELRESYQLYIDNVKETIKEIEKKYGSPEPAAKKNNVLN